MELNREKYSDFGPTLACEYLVKENEQEVANAFLDEEFLADLNEKFILPARERRDLHRRLPRLVSASCADSDLFSLVSCRVRFSCAQAISDSVVSRIDCKYPYSPPSLRSLPATDRSDGVDKTVAFFGSERCCSRAVPIAPPNPASLYALYFDKIRTPP